ncbi:DUF4221 family protein [Algoriphagus chordae]|uniref:Uncharacterized protein DUF4221 n=1 Tax=Algoriphagus chordae TaxID=237019 RepID=A0A2W7RC31_9BACT|nr:DUF4221 family protein [Algoriphagus chordae]PZX53267.1 uncharacterized protein DUF4221 [Algoriphagus chordae]
MRIAKLVVILLLSASCNQKQKDLSLADFLINTESFSIDQHISPSTFRMQYIDGSLFWWNRDHSSITEIDLTDKVSRPFLKYQFEGPNGIGSPSGFYMVSRDSIFFPSKLSKIFLVNNNSEVLNSFDYLSLGDHKYSASSFTRYTRPFHFYANQLFFEVGPQLVPTEFISEDFLKSYSPFVTLNLNQGTFEELPMRFTSSAHFKFGPNTLNMVFAASEEKYLIIGTRTDMLYYYDLSTQEIEEIQLESQLLTRFSNAYFEADRMGNTIEENMRLLYKDSQNIGLLVDQHRKLLYRIGFAGEEVSADLDAMKYSEFLPTFTISIYDIEDEFSLLSEFSLLRNTYLAHHYFVDEKGLNLFPMHPENPEFNEDEMVIHTFDFGSLKK